MSPLKISLSVLVTMVIVFLGYLGLDASLLTSEKTSSACCQSAVSHMSAPDIVVAQANRKSNCSCGGVGCICAFDSCGSGGAEVCGCGGIDCDCVSKRCPKFSTVSDCTGFKICDSDGQKHCNRHECP